MQSISVIVPVYNIEEYITECIESITQQTYEDIEVILVDDGSTDKSGQICDEYAKKDNRIRVFHIKNSGPSVARNFGLEKSTGDYIMFVDSDDWIEKDTLQISYDMINKYKSDIVLFNLCDFKENFIQEHHLLNGITRLFEEKKLEYIKNIMLTTKGENDDDGSTVALTGPVCKLYRKQIVLNCLFPENIKSGEDACFVSQVLDNTKRLLYIEKMFYHRRVLSSSLSHFCSENYGEDRLKYVNWILNYYKGKKSDELLNTFCFNNYCLVVQNIMENQSIKYSKKKKIIYSFLEGINKECDFKDIKIQCKNRNMRIIKRLIKSKKLFVVWILFQISILKNKLL